MSTQRCGLGRIAHLPACIVGNLLGNAGSAAWAVLGGYELQTMEEISELLPVGWSAKKRLKGGGQANATVVRHSDGREGVFRTLKDSHNARSRERFCREIGILCGRVEHRSLVKIFEWCLDGETPWYIGELGDSFERWWCQWKRRKGRTSAEVVNMAVWVVRELASALALCHREGIIHRNIKPKNVVVKRGEEDPWPILIDFGVAYDECSPRLTPTSDAVGNARFSRDIMRMRVEEVRPWLDVFELGQLMIWMLDADAPKAHWSRPVHWNHAKYPNDIGEDSLMAIRGFTAVYSTETVAPRDGSECVKLLSALFADGERNGTSEKDSVGRIARAKRQGMAKRLLIDQALAAELEAGAPLAEAVYSDLRRTLLSLCDVIREEEPSLAVDVENEFDCRVVGATDLFWMRVGEDNASIQLRVKCKVVPWSEPGLHHKSNVEFWRKHLPKDAICFTFAIEGGVVAAGNIRYLQGRWPTILRGGGLNLHSLEAGFGPYSNNDLGGSANDDGTPATMADVRAFAESVLTDEEYWTHVTAMA
ncbi:MAG: protein kinase [Boseongicola sp.]|nr:protein kinase [Boseongicola sp.]